MKNIINSNISIVNQSKLYVFVYLEIFNYSYVFEYILSFNL